jgi:nitronate monooxygenase
LRAYSPEVKFPAIIQGGMGAGVSSWKLARTVSAAGQLGVVSGIALDVILIRRLQDGDPDGTVRHALAHFPLPEIAERIVERYFIPEGRRKGRPYRTVPMHSVNDRRTAVELCIAGSFVEVFLAREGHSNPVGINFLEKIQLPKLPAIYGAMLAGVAVVLVGAGIATKLPGVLEAFTLHQPAAYEIRADDATDTVPFRLHLDPRDFLRADLSPLRRPLFFPIVSSDALARIMLDRSNGPVDGFVVEGATAGGHNAPPRGRMKLDESGQPVYGEKDQVDLSKMRELGVPFWLAGGQATAERLREALAAGAAGVQVGTAFAFCEESGLDPRLRRSVLEKVRAGTSSVFTDPLASPTGFPFKVVALEGSLSERPVYEARTRVCDLGFLRQILRSPEGEIVYRCPAEPVADWVRKGGAAAEAVGRKCLCNGLLANIGLGQSRRDGTVEGPLLTAGDELRFLDRFLENGSTSYTAIDVIDSLIS